MMRRLFLTATRTLTSVWAAHVTMTYGHSCLRRCFWGIHPPRMSRLYFTGGGGWGVSERTSSILVFTKVVWPLPDLRSSLFLDLFFPNIIGSASRPQGGPGEGSRILKWSHVEAATPAGQKIDLLSSESIVANGWRALLTLVCTLFKCFRQ